VRQRNNKCFEALLPKKLQLFHCGNAKRTVVMDPEIDLSQPLTISTRKKYVIPRMEARLLGNSAAPKSKIVGCVLSEWANPIGAAKVTCDGQETMTLFDGSYEFENISVGNYDVSVSLKGFRPERKTVSIKENETKVVNFSLVEARGTSNICGYVRDSRTKRPLSGGRVILTLPVANRYALIDENGFYEFAGLQADTYDIWASVPGYEEIKATVVLADGETKAQDFDCKAQAIEEPPWG